MKIAKRQARESDHDWLFNLKVASMRTYVEQIYGWKDAVQKEFFDKGFCPNDITMITVDGLDAGMFELVRDCDGYFLRRIEIHPSYHNKGIGSHIVKEILSQAASERENTRLMVFKINPAQNLYKRLGFEVVGETEVHYKMLCCNKLSDTNAGT